MFQRLIIVALVTLCFGGPATAADDFVWLHCTMNAEGSPTSLKMARDGSWVSLARHSPERAQRISQKNGFWVYEKLTTKLMNKFELNQFVIFDPSTMGLALWPIDFADNPKMFDIISQGLGAACVPFEYPFTQ